VAWTRVFHRRGRLLDLFDDGLAGSKQHAGSGPVWVNTVVERPANVAVGLFAFWPASRMSASTLIATGKRTRCWPRGSSGSVCGCRSIGCLWLDMIVFSVALSHRSALKTHCRSTTGRQGVLALNDRSTSKYFWSAFTGHSPRVRSSWRRS
jgi:hypothetical protein